MDSSATMSKSHPQTDSEDDVDDTMTVGSLTDDHR